MESESLKIVRNKIIELLNREDINIFDKTELMINLNKFLDPLYYEENIRKLQKK